MTTIKVRRSIEISIAARDDGDPIGYVSIDCEEGPKSSTGKWQLDGRDVDFLSLIGAIWREAAKQTTLSVVEYDKAPR